MLEGALLEGAETARGGGAPVVSRDEPADDAIQAQSSGRPERNARQCAHAATRRARERRRETQASSTARGEDEKEGRQQAVRVKRCRRRELSTVNGPYVHRKCGTKVN